MEEQATEQMSKEEWGLYVDEMLFRMSKKPRKWREWGFPSLKKRRAELLRLCLKQLKAARKETKELVGRESVKLLQHFKLLKNESPEIQEHYLQVFAMLTLAASAPGRFFNLITNPETFPESIFWRQIGVHNLFQGYKFRDLGLDLEGWSDYPEVIFEITGNQDFSPQWERLNKELDLLDRMFAGHPLRSSLRKDCLEIKKKKQAILAGQLELSESGWLAELFPKFFKSRDHWRRKTNKPGSGRIIEMLERPEIIRRIILEIKESQGRCFSVAFWERNNPMDILSGNLIGNCLSVGERSTFPAIKLPGVPCKERPAGILDYLVDRGVQVIMIREMLGDDLFYSVGQCYLYVFMDNGKPVLMADSIDFHPYYHKDRRKILNTGLREAIFDFLKDYARAVGIERVVLAKNGPVLESGEKKGQRHQIQNDLDVSDLPVVRFEKIEKFGGYWNHHPYFLESVGGTEAYVIM
jgi:hypothetical protein